MHFNQGGMTINSSFQCIQHVDEKTEQAGMVAYKTVSESRNQPAGFSQAGYTLG